MVTMSIKKQSVIWLALAAAIYAVVRFGIGFSALHDSTSSFFGYGSWEANAFILGIGLIIVLPGLASFLVFRGVCSWWLLLPLVLSIIALPTVISVLSVASLVVWLLDKNCRASA